MARRRQRRKREKEQRRAPSSVTPPIAADGHVGGPVERLVYSREQAAQALGISLATLDDIPRRLNHDKIPPGQGGRKGGPSTVRAVLVRKVAPFERRAMAE